MLDLYGGWFWAVVAAALLCVPITRGEVRTWCLATINLAALVPVLRERVVAVVAGAFASWLGLRLVASGGARRVALAAGGSVTLVLFLVHKRPDLVAARWSGLPGAVAILTAVGFSYVALRLVDAARAINEGRLPPPSLPATVNYLLPFHMLLAGPIQSYEDFLAQPAVPPAPEVEATLASIERIASGMFKKYVVAHAIESLFLTGYRASGWYTLLEIQLSYLWLYLDFSAYSDVAIGVGGLIGVATPENFRAPLRARNLIDYWERWHITLSQFIRRDLFIPIQLALVRRTDGRRPLLAASLAFTASFLLCGLWHSVSLRWLGWGAMHAAGLVACNLYRAWLLRRLGRKGLNAYMARPLPAFLGVVATFEYAALALAAATYPFEDFFTWTAYPG